MTVRVIAMRALSGHLTTFYHLMRVRPIKMDAPQPTFDEGASIISHRHCEKRHDVIFAAGNHVFDHR